MKHFFLHDDFIPRTDCSIGAAVIGAVGSIGGAFMSSKGAKDAAEAQAAAAAQATAAQREMFNLSREQLQPFIDAGKGVLPGLTNWVNPNAASSPLASLLKLTTPGADMSAALAQTPGYQFTLDQGLRTVNNALAARGLAGPGGALARGSADYATGLAQNTWGNVVGNLLNTYNAGASTMQNVAGLGGNAASSLTGAAGQTGQGIANNMIGAGNAQAGASIASGNAWGGAMSNIGNSFGNQYTLNTLRGLMPNSGGGLYNTAAGPSSISAWYNA